MNFSHSPLLRAFLESANKSLLIQTKRTPDVSLSKLKKLEPVRDIDDRIVSYSSNPERASRCQSTAYEDCFERMSFEHEAKEPDFWRDDELYKYGDDYHDYIYSKYTPDDVSLADSIIERHVGLKHKIPQIYYPQTDFSFDQQSVLKLMEFEEHLVPSSFEKRLNVDDNTIREFAKECVHAWENGLATNQIIRLLEKSVVKGSEKTPSHPDVDLFNFLTRHPNKRPLVVIKVGKEQEFFDKPASMYYDSFSKKYFADKETALKVLDECKTFDNIPDIPTVDLKLCDVACMLRRRTALGLPEKRNIYNSKEMYCEPTTPWGPQESELLARIKPDGFLDEDYYELVRTMICNESKPVSYVLEHIDDVVKRKKEIDEIVRNLDRQYVNSYIPERNIIAENLRSEAYNARKHEEMGANSGRVILDMVKTLQDRNVPVRGTCRIVQIMDSMRRDGDIHYASLKKIANLCSEPGKLSISATDDLMSMCRILYNKTEHFGRFEAEIMEKVCKNALKGDMSYYSAMNYVLKHSGRDLNSIVKANLNLDELAKYMKRYKSLSQGNAVFFRNRSYIEWALDSELKHFMTSENVKVSDCKKLELVEKFCSEKLSYEEFLVHMKNLLHLPC